MKPLAQNKRALFDYEILEKFEAGLVLTGQEVKSAKSGHISLPGSFVTIHNGEAFLTNATIAPYKLAGKLEHYDETRSRKLLLHKDQISSLIGKTQQKGLTLIPIMVYIKNNLVKLEFGIARGRKKVDKREYIKKRESRREMRKVF